MINFTAYQAWVRTKVRTPVQCSALGLAGEAGEVVDLLKKAWFHGKLLDCEALKLELGDCLFYLTDLADKHGIDLESVAQGNVDKINARYPNAFNIQDAQKAEAAKDAHRKQQLAFNAFASPRRQIVKGVDWDTNPELPEFED